MKLNFIKEIDREEMKQEQKDLLLKDLCGRLPYEVKIRIEYPFLKEEEWHPEILYGLDLQRLCIANTSIRLEEVKPYLFPLSSMTREKREEFVKFADYEPRAEDCGRHQELYYYDLVGHENNLYPNSDAIDWLNKNHFDYRGLIEKGLANDATNLNIY